MTGRLGYRLIFEGYRHAVADRMRATAATAWARLYDSCQSYLQACQHVTTLASEGAPNFLMARKLTVENPPTEVFRALSDPVRWSIIVQMAQVDELACITLEDTLPVSKPTISYHTKILQNAGLISTRKAGRNYYYSLRRDVLSDLIGGLHRLASTPGPVAGTQNGSAPTGRRRKRHDPAGLAASSRQGDVSSDIEETTVLTW